MFDTMTVTKAVGALCGAFLIFLLGKWAAEATYHVGAGHGDGEEHAQGYVIDTGASEAAEAEPEVSFEEVFAAADAGSGERVFGKCRACHKLEDGANAAGPHLYGLVGRPIASVDGFNYSSALADLPGDWAPEELSAFLESPKGYAPGTAMSFNGLPKIEDRANLIAYLATIGG
ncbi:c-type cytochrome [Poseidonocella sedimentorum]|uniref:Cytochrome c n=1 Tax=Poseidonocella sedimentorum TaxID=871652 RepID=A0A1I6DU18_9RHOB|nr:cytochrome c family protein [Poseidonocella sedimentorum]SFR08955.1 cytochrome c [Poseidonocella sedimentorum]